MSPRVLIVGAGPTGLVLALVLRHRGVDVRIVDKHPGVLEATKSAALHARTLEYLRDLGVADRILAEGQRVDVLTLRTGYRDRLTVDFRVLADTAYPYILDIPQARTEHILLDALAEAGVTVERATTCTGIEDTGDEARVHLATPAGESLTATADWVVGCDGVHSTMRDLLGLAFAGDAYADDWVLCDAVVDWPLPRNEMTFSGDRDGIYGVFPLPGQRRYRLAYTQRRDARGELVPPDLADAQVTMARTGVAGTVESVDSFWTFHLAHRQAAGYRRGRVFLAGDAGHVHTPFGGQGLNLGVADAVNLGWKLAAVATGWAPASLLDSYEAERHRVARQVVAFTHLGARAMLMRGDPRRHLRDAVFTVLQSRPRVRRRAARRLSQLGHTYRRSRAWNGRSRSPRAGDRLPDAALYDGVTGRTVRLHDTLPADRPALLLTAPGDTASLTGAVHTLEELRRREWPDLPEVRVLTTAWDAPASLPPESRVLLDRHRDAAAWRLYGRGPTAYVVRPDRHLAYAGPPDPERVSEYLATVRLPAADPPELVTIDLWQSTAYAVRGEQVVLVDAGPAGHERRLLRRLSRAGVAPDEIALIVLTHCHPDHAGGAAELRRQLGVPVAVHAAEVDWATTGTSAFYDVQRPFGHLVRRLLPPRFPAFPPDLVLTDGTALDEYGAPLTALHTPGHTPGSVTLLHRPAGDALVGDLMAGGMLRRDRPGLPFLAEDPAQLRRSVADVLAHVPGRLLFGHGRPASASAVHRWTGHHRPG